MASSSSAVAKRKSDYDLMPPPPPTKRIKRPTQVLDEDTYSDALTQIIAQDFFPGLLELESQEEYLDALASKDDEWIETAGRRVTAAMTPQPGQRRGVAFTPSREESFRSQTPRTRPTSATEKASEESPKVDKNLSLNGFLAKYTSEDAESFNKVLDMQNQKRAEKHAWLWNDNKIPEPRQIAWRQQQQKLLKEREALEASDGPMVRIDTLSDDRPAGPASWKYVGKNGLMFQPGGLEDDIQTIQQHSEEISRAAPKKVLYNNTRMQTQLSGAPAELSVPPSPTLSAIKDAIAGRPRISASEGGYDGSETSRVNGYAFVDSEEPEPEPATARNSDWSRLSFGEVDSTKNPFSMQESSSREQLHHRMVEKVSKGKRDETLRKSIKTPVPGTTPQSRASATPVKSLTPAGHQLLGRLGGSTPRRGLNSGGIWSAEKGKTPRGPLLKGLVTPRQ